MAPKWGHHPVPKLIINEGEGAPSPSSQISALSGLAAAAVIADTNSDFLGWPRPSKRTPPRARSKSGYMMTRTAFSMTSLNYKTNPKRPSGST